MCRHLRLPVSCKRQAQLGIMSGSSTLTLKNVESVVYGGGGTSRRRRARGQTYIEAFVHLALFVRLSLFRVRSHP